MPTLLKILSELDLEKRIHEMLVDCREICNLHAMVVMDIRETLSHFQSNTMIIKIAKILVDAIEGMIAKKWRIMTLI